MPSSQKLEIKKPLAILIPFLFLPISQQMVDTVLDPFTHNILVLLGTTFFILGYPLLYIVSLEKDRLMCYIVKNVNMSNNNLQCKILPWAFLFLYLLNDTKSSNEYIYSRILKRVDCSQLLNKNNQSNKQKLPQTNKHTKDRGLSTQKYLGNGGLNRVKQIILLLLQCISESLNLLICSIISQREQCMQFPQVI